MNYWKAYSVIFLASYVTVIGKADGVADWIDVFVSGFGFVALIGYAFDRQILRPLIWRFVFWVLLIDNWWSHFRSERESLLIELASVLLVIPGFIAVFRYGHSASIIWRNNVPTVSEIEVEETL